MVFGIAALTVEVASVKDLITRLKLRHRFTGRNDLTHSIPTEHPIFAFFNGEKLANFVIDRVYCNCLDLDQQVMPRCNRLGNVNVGE